MAQGITIDINANVARFSSQLDRATSDINRFANTTQRAAGFASKALAAIGAGISFAAITAAAKASIDLADNLNDLSKKTGIAVENLAGLNLAAKQSGTDLEGLALGVNKLSINIAKNGESFRELGISAKDPLQAFAQLADVLSSIEDPQQRAAVANKALGKSYAELMPLLLEGGDSIRSMTDEGRKASGITAQMAKDADALNDQIALLSTQFQGLVNKGIGPLLPSMVALLEYLNSTDSDASTTGRSISILASVFGTLVEYVATAAHIINRFGLGLGAIAAKINAISHLNFSGLSVIDKSFHEDIDKADAKLQNLYNKIENPNAATVDVTAKIKPPSDITLQKFIGAEGAGGGGKGRGGGGAGASAEEARSKGIQDIIAGLRQDIALSKLSEDQRRKEIELSNALKNARGAERTIISDLIKTKYDEIEATSRQEAQWKALIEDANAYYDLRKEISDLAMTDLTLDSFSGGLAKIQDKMKEGVINQEQAKGEFDKLGKAFNESYVSPSEKKVDELSQFAIQGARNMQTAFADFLFDPFAQGMDGMLIGFLNVIRRMVAEIAASQLSKALVGDFGKGNSSVVGGLIGEAGRGLSSWIGGTLTSTASSAGGQVIESGVSTALSGFLKGLFATGGVVSGSGIGAYSGSIITKPTLFPFATGIGLMGEAGPEAILPLKRGPGGRLGIEAGSSHNQRSLTVVNNFTLNQPADKRTQDQIAATAALSIKRATNRNL
jgi:hypothetical protein